ncbi:hypothetical protein [Sharpea porci]|uniref:hypothetical protein n=1 Tax=Sharpea porci TaxID=2652286 RepID=UPI002A9129D7|nr:hypothetical protein [Sharpea porci]MDY5280156.1 hypothetical protein [Sharpea porci]
MKNNHKKLIASIALVGTMAAGGTFALLQTETGTATNNFTSTKNIAGILYEDHLGDKFVDRTTKADDETQEIHTTGGSWKDYLPTQTQTKDPTIKIYKKSVPAYVGMKVKYIIDGTAVSKETFNTRLATLHTTGTDANADGINDKWTESAHTNAHEYFYTYADKVDAGDTTEALFNSIEINKEIKDENYGNVAANLPSFKIEASGYAVQAEGTANSHKDDLKALAKIQ